MNTTALANAIISSAIEFMVVKSGATAGEILETIATDPTGNTARHFAGLIAAGVRNADAILAGAQVTAETIK